MELKKFNLGDLVCLKVHPFFEENNQIIISGEASMLSPIMVVAEVLKAKHTDKQTGEITYNIKYKCIWFASKLHKFEDAWVFEADLKLFKSTSVLIDNTSIRRGDKVTLKTIVPESSKKKSSLTYEDNSISKGNSNTIINSLLSFLPPIIQVLEVTKHQHKLPLKDKGDLLIRIVSEWNVKCLSFDPIAHKMSEVFLPIEVLQLVNEIDLKVVNYIQDAIGLSKLLYIKEEDIVSLVKPRHIAYRNGIYYLRAYDYVFNKINEIEITSKQEFTTSSNPFKNKLPSFNIAKDPSSATSKFIIKELVLGIEEARKRANYIRIKYRSRNETISKRTLMDYKIIKIKGFLKDDYYVEGYCFNRMAKRIFRIDRIQNFQELELEVKK